MTTTFTMPKTLADVIGRIGIDKYTPLGGAIPATLSEVTASWLTDMLSTRYPGVEVVAAQVGDFMGYKPNKARVTLEYNEAGRKAGLPATMIVKGGFSGGSEAGALTGLDIGLELELLAYGELMAQLDVNTPRCFGVRFDRDNYTGAMLIEDLAPLGATFLKEAICLERQQALDFLDAMARFHAPWLGSAEFAPGGKFGPESGLGERTERLHSAYLNKLVRPEYWDTFVALPRGAALPRMLQDATRVAAAQEKLNMLLRDCAQTIVHGDEHLGNLYIDAAGKPGFIDWCARREPWVLGFTYFLMSTLDALDRREWEQPLLRHYLDRLAHHGVPHGTTIPNFDQAWHLYRCAVVFPFLTWFNNSAKWQPESVNTRNTMRAALAIIDHDSFRLLGV